ncbi:MAG: hypothetical protein AMXMBFR34_50830 [Myxococcaceae bacterium]
MAPSSGRSVAASRAEPSGALPATPDEGALPETTSGGGPVVLLPAEVAAAWRGTLAPPGATVPPGWTWGKRGGPRTDYDRALEPNDAKQTARGGYGWLSVGSGRALIFSDELTTVWLPTGDGGGARARRLRCGAREGARLGPEGRLDDLPRGRAA